MDTRLTSLNNERVAGASEAKTNINDLVVDTSETSHNIDAYSRNLSKHSCNHDTAEERGNKRGKVGNRVNELRADGGRRKNTVGNCVN